MSTSLGDLLASAEHELNSLDEPDARTTAIAIATLKPIGRALTELAAEASDRKTQALILETTRAFAAAEKAWPPTQDRPAALLEAAADLIAIAPPRTTERAWAVTVAFADIALTALDRATAFSLVADHDLLRRARETVYPLQRAAAADPPTRRGSLVLDDLLHHPAGLDGTSPQERAAEGIVSLVAAVRRSSSAARLTVGELLSCAAACEAAARLTVHVLPAPGDQRTVAAAVSAWRAVHVACAAFDDGTKAVPSDASPVLALAGRVAREFDSAIGLMAAREKHESEPVVEAMAQFRLVANQIPLAAAALEAVPDAWTRSRRIVALERNLASFEKRNEVATTGINRIVRVARSDLDELRSTLRDAKVLSTAIAGAVNAAPQIKPGPDRQPRLTADYAAAALNERRGLATRSARAERIAHRTAEQWTIAHRSHGGRAR